MSDKLIYSIKNLTLKNGDKTLLENFTLEIFQNQIIGIFAPTGTGKTTLLNYISENFQSVSYAYQDLRLLNLFSPFKNVILPLENKLSKSEAKLKAEKWLNDFELSDKKFLSCEKLSGGEKQRVCLARAFAYPAELLLLDEPFSSQDQEKKEKFLNITKEFIKNGESACIIVSHDKKDLEKICHKILELSAP
ncbi:MAG: ATP-binding cassette domain-containing protein [Treponema sp.]|nr:ATP-binding cassette domain-containing protein [Treponema sp.]